MRMTKFVAARIKRWLDAERSDDPLIRPLIGIRELHIYFGLFGIGVGAGILVGLQLGMGYGIGAFAFVSGSGMFFLGRWP